MLDMPMHARTSGIVVCINMYQYGRIPVRAFLFGGGIVLSRAIRQ